MITLHAAKKSQPASNRNESLVSMSMQISPSAVRGVQEAPARPRTADSRTLLREFAPSMRLLFCRRSRRRLMHMLGHPGLVARLHLFHLGLLFGRQHLKQFVMNARFGDHQLNLCLS